MGVTRPPHGRFGNSRLIFAHEAEAADSDFAEPSGTTARLR